MSKHYVNWIYIQYTDEYTGGAIGLIYSLVTNSIIFDNPYAGHEWEVVQDKLILTFRLKRISTLFDAYHSQLSVTLL